MSFEIVEGDLEPDMELSVTVNGEVKDLSAAVSYALLWRDPDGTVGTLALEEVDLELGTLRHVWEAGDTDVVGAHRGQVVVTWAEGETQTFPSDGTHYIWFVNPRLA
jgi:hypothetical protein